MEIDSDKSENTSNIIMPDQHGDIQKCEYRQLNAMTMLNDSDPAIRDELKTKLKKEWAIIQDDHETMRQTTRRTTKINYMFLCSVLVTFM